MRARGAAMREPEWFKGVWDGALNPCYTIAGYNRIEGEVHGVVRRIAVWLFEDERFLLAYDQRDMHRVGAALVARFRRDPRHLRRTWAALARLAGEIEGALRALRSRPPVSWPGARLAAAADRLHGLFATLFGWTSMPEPCGLYLQARLAERCAARFGADAGPIYQARLMAPTFVSWARREAWARGRLAAALAALPERARRADRLPAPLARALARHAARYGFLRHNYLTAPRTSAADVFATVVAELEASRREGTPLVPAEPPAPEARRVARDRARLIEAHRLGGEVGFLVRTLDDLSRLQDERKRLVLRTMGGLDAILREAARRACEPVERLRAWLPDEVSALLRDGTRPAPREVAARLAGCAVVAREGVRRLTSEPGAVARWRARLTRVPPSLNGALAGTPASRGVASGPARVLLSAREVGRVRRGDVLVAGNTTPDYMPALRRAAAVLAEKGGMTSHAALIARELGIPCLVGVAQVTRRVEDGARLRVDADRGVAVVEDSRAAGRAGEQGSPPLGGSVLPREKERGGASSVGTPA